MKKISNTGLHHSVWRILSLTVVFLFVFTLSCNKVTDQFPWRQSGNDKGNDIGNIKHETGDLVYDWTDMQLRIILNSNPTIGNGVVIRFFGYCGIAVYEAAQRGMPGNTSLSGRINQMPEMPQPTGNNYSWSVSANTTYAAMTRAFFLAMTTAQKASVDSLEKAYNDRLKQNLMPDVFTRSQSFGQSIVAAILQWSASDLFSQANAPYTRPDFPGAWEPTPPLFGPPITPYAGNIRPFLQIHASGNSAPPPFAYSETVGSDYYNMIRDIYDVSFNRTTDQTNMALWWNDLGLYIGYTPPGHIMNVVNTVLRQEHRDLITSIQVNAKAGMALWDGLIMCFRSKYQYNQMRPVTYIARFIDPNWLPLIPTPSHPEYPAAHAYITSAAMAAAASEIGDHHEFIDRTYEFLGWPARPFSTLNDVGIEAGNSRRFGGIHYAPSITTGHNDGKKVGEEIGAISFKK